MAYDILVWNTIKSLERDHEESQGIEHLIGKTGLAVITDHRNPDGLFDSSPPAWYERHPSA